MTSEMLPGALMAPPCIAAVGTALPGQPIDNEALSRRIGVDENWIDVFIGTKTRHFAVDLDTGRQFATLADLCAEAAQLALDRAGYHPRDVDFIVMSTASPDELMPATVNHVADRLGIDGIPTYQIQSGCAGAVQALDLGTLLLQRASHEVGLVIGGDVCARHLSLDRDFSRLPSSELVNYVLFGDGAGAAVVTRKEEPGGLYVRHVLNRLSGLGQQPGQIIRWFGDATRHGDEQAVIEHYKAIEARVPVMANEVFAQLLDLAGWRREDLSHVLPPQLAGRMTTRIARQLEIGEAQEISCVADTGNNGNALPFLQIEQLLMRGHAGCKAIGISIESSKWIRGGFALEGV